MREKERDSIVRGRKNKGERGERKAHKNFKEIVKSKGPK
jgi:hypothetical protein